MSVILCQIRRATAGTFDEDRTKTLLNSWVFSPVTVLIPFKNITERRDLLALKDLNRD